ncbi:MAG: hypothetical protein ABIH87_03500 [bacterium]
MRIAHIVPSTFEYFDDIKMDAFETVEQLSKYGIESIITTLQYSQAKRREKEKISGKAGGPAGKAPSYKYQGMQSIIQAIENFSSYDLVHLHCPFLGAGGKILEWKRKNPDTPLAVTYYRPVELVDFLSYFIRLYNSYYLSKIMRLAEVVMFFPQTYPKSRFSFLDQKKMVDITPTDHDEHSLTVDLTNICNKVKLDNAIIDKLSISKLVYVYSLLI